MGPISPVYQMTTRLDTLPLELQDHIHDLARPVCGDCPHPYDNTFAHTVDQGCACEFCEGCLLEALWLHPGCDTPASVIRSCATGAGPRLSRSRSTKI